MRVGAGDHSLTGLDGLAQTVEHGAREFRQFIQEQNAQMREADFAGLHFQSATHQRRHRGGVVRVAEGTRTADRAAFQRAGQRLDKRYLQRALGAFLALDVAQVGRTARWHRHLWHWRCQHGGALHVIDQRNERWRGENFHCPGKGRFRAAGLGTDQAAPLFVGGDGGGQHARHGGDGCIQRQLAQRHVIRHLADRQHAHRGQQAQRNGQVIVRAFLGQVGGREVDGDALERQRQPDGGQRGAHSLAAFRRRLVGQADDIELASAAVGNVHLHVHRTSLDALERNGIDMSDGRGARCETATAQAHNTVRQEPSCVIPSG